MALQSWADLARSEDQTVIRFLVGLENFLDQMENHFSDHHSHQDACLVQTVDHLVHHFSVRFCSLTEHWLLSAISTWYDWSFVDSTSPIMDHNLWVQFEQVYYRVKPEQEVKSIKLFRTRWSTDSSREENKNSKKAQKEQKIWPGSPRSTPRA